MARQTAWWLNGDFAAVCAFVFLCTRSCFVLYSGGKQLVYLSRFSMKPQANDYVINKSGDKKDKVKKVAAGHQPWSTPQLFKTGVSEIGSSVPSILSVRTAPPPSSNPLCHFLYTLYNQLPYQKLLLLPPSTAPLVKSTRALDGKLQFHSGGPKPLSCILLLLFLGFRKKKNKQIYSMHMYW